jgi:predicted glutamine amidotransferase
MIRRRPRTPVLVGVLGIGLALSAALLLHLERASRRAELPAGPVRTRATPPTGEARRPRPVSGDLGDPEHACRFWGLIGTGYPAGLIEDDLRSGTITNLRQLGASNHDGWGFASFLPDTLGRLLRGPLVRRGRPPSTHPQDPDFDLAVDEIAELNPRASLGHVRAASSGHFGLPDPHPFLHEGFAFAHNGTVSCTTMVGLLTGDDPGYLETHPPEYINGYIDSELLFLYLLKYRHAHPALPRAEALRDAAAALFEIVAPARLNFVMTAGDTLYALRCGGHDEYDPVRYYPNAAGSSSVGDPHGKTEPSPFWVVASQPVGSDLNLWAPFPPRTLGVFVPGEAPRFLPLASGPQPVFSIPWAFLTDAVDLDGDGFVSSFTVNCAPQVDSGEHRAWIRVLAFFGEAGMVPVAASDTFTVVSGVADTIRIPVLVRPSDQPPDTWDLRLQLFTPTDPEQPQAELGSEVEPRLANIRIEGPASDGHPSGEPLDSLGPPGPPALPDPPASPVTSAWIGVSRPNPSRDGFVIPVRLPAEATPRDGGAASLEIWDARGALVWRTDVFPAGLGEREIRWDGRDRQGQRVAAGIYFCRVRAGGKTAESRLTIVR